MSDTNNLGPITTGFEALEARPTSYFNNLSLPPLNVSQDVGDAVQSFFEKSTGNAESARIVATAVIYTSATQGIDPMVTLEEFQRLPPGQLNEYLVTFLNFNRIGTSLLGLMNNPFSNALISRTVIV